MLRSIFDDKFAFAPAAFDVPVLIGLVFPPLSGPSLGPGPVRKGDAG